MLDQQIRQILSNTAASRVQILTALAELERAEEIAIAEIDALREKRCALLLDGDDPALDACERDLAAATRRLERAEAALATLYQRLEARRP